MLQWEKYSEAVRLAAIGLLPGHNVAAYVRSSGQLATDPASITSKFYTSLTTAWNAVTGSNNVIVILPGHSEGVGTTMLSSAVAGTMIVGVGPSDQDDAPTFTWSGATANWAVAVKNLTFANLRLIADADNVTEGITVTAAGFKMIDCYVDAGLAAAKDFASFLNFSTGADNGLVLNNTMRATAGGLATMIKGGTVVDNLRIVGNRIYGGSSSTTVGAIHISAAVTNLFIGHNYVDNQVGSSTAAISFTNVAATGFVSYNVVGVLANAATPAQAGILPGGASNLVHFHENYSSDGLVQTSGILSPTVTS